VSEVGSVANGIISRMPLACHGEFLQLGVALVDHVLDRAPKKTQNGPKRNLEKRRPMVYIDTVRPAAAARVRGPGFVL
jgi:hypothetical protein